MQYKQITFDDLEEIRKKVCTKCQIEKPLKDFYRHSTTKSGRHTQCKICINEHQKEYDKNNRKNKKEYQKEYYQNNKEKVIKKSKEYYKNNKKKLDKRNKEYYQNTKEKRKEKRREYKKEYLSQRYKTDVNFKLASNLRSRIKNAIKNNYKTSSSIELLGCSIQEVREHLESQFQEGMTWDNHSLDGWHIDHIKPCASFDLSDPEQQKECFHYTNLQPLWAKENISKGDKIDEV